MNMHDVNTFTVFHVTLDKNMTVGQYACELHDKPWSSSGLENLLGRLTIQGVQTILMVVVGLYH